MFSLGTWKLYKYRLSLPSFPHGSSRESRGEPGFPLKSIAGMTELRDLANGISTITESLKGKDEKATPNTYY